MCPHKHTEREDKVPLNLLFTNGEDGSHYTWIKHFDRLLAMMDILKYSVHTDAGGMINDMEMKDVRKMENK